MLGGLLGATPTAGQRGQPAARVLFQGKLIAVSFRASINSGPPAQEAPPKASAVFLVREAFANSWTLWRDTIEHADLARTVDLASLTHANYAESIQALLPADVRVGDDVLVEIAWDGTERSIVSIEPHDPARRRAYFERRADFLVESDREVVQELAPAIIAGVGVTTKELERRRALAEGTVDRERRDESLRLARESLAVQLKMVQAHETSLQACADRLAVLAKDLPASRRESVDELARELAEHRATLKALRERMAVEWEKSAPGR